MRGVKLELVSPCSPVSSPTREAAALIPPPARRRRHGRWLALGAVVTPFPDLGTALRRTSLDNGLILRVDPSWFAVAPALIAEEADLDEMVALIDKSLKEALDRVAGLA